MEESNNSKEESLLEGVNLQVVITACQAQRQDMIPQDLIQKIERALRKEINNDTTIQTQQQGQGILTVQDPESRYSPKELRKRGRKTNIKALKSVGALLINSGQIQPIEGFFPHHTPTN